MKKESYYSEDQLELVQSAPARPDWFAPGDLVFLNSGGHAMRVISNVDDTCIVDLNGDEIEFPAICLTKCERSKPNDRGWYDMAWSN